MIIYLLGCFSNIQAAVTYQIVPGTKSSNYYVFTNLFNITSTGIDYSRSIMKMNSEDSVIWNISFKSIFEFMPLAIDDEEKNVYVAGITDTALTVVILNSTTGIAQSQK